jgi:hypothetical protein
MNSKIKKLVATVALAGAATAGMAGAAFAADGTTSTTGPTGTAKNPSAQGARRHPGLRRALRRGALKVVLDTVGGTKEELRAALKGGKTISDYATSQGKDPKVVADALIKAADDKIDQLVTDGKLDSTRADTMKVKVPGRVDKLMKHQFGQHAAGAPKV